MKLFKNKKAQGPDVLIGFLLVAVLALGGLFFLNSFVSSLSLNGLLSVLDAENEQACIFMMLPLMGSDYIRQGYSLDEINSIPHSEQYALLKSYFGESEYEQFSAQFNQTITGLNTMLKSYLKPVNTSYYYGDCSQNCWHETLKGTDSYFKEYQPFIPQHDGFINRIYIRGNATYPSSFNTPLTMTVHPVCTSSSTSSCIVGHADPSIVLIKRTISAEEIRKQNFWIAVDVADGHTVFEKGQTYFISIDTAENISTNPFKWYSTHVNGAMYNEKSLGSADFISEKDRQYSVHTGRSLYYSVEMNSATTDYAFSPIKISEINGFMASREVSQSIIEHGGEQFNVFRATYSCSMAVYNPYFNYGYAQIYVVIPGQ